MTKKVILYGYGAEPDLSKKDLNEAYTTFKRHEAMTHAEVEAQCQENGEAYIYKFELKLVDVKKVKAPKNV